jgi:hypothetical protein
MKWTAVRAIHIMSRLHSFHGHLLTGSSMLLHQSLGNTDLSLKLLTVFRLFTSLGILFQFSITAIGEEVSAHIQSGRSLVQVQWTICTPGSSSSLGGELEPSTGLNSVYLFHYLEGLDHVSLVSSFL